MLHRLIYVALILSLSMAGCPRLWVFPPHKIARVPRSLRLKRSAFQRASAYLPGARPFLSL
jgi:hypothetical protein